MAGKSVRKRKKGQGGPRRGSAVMAAAAALSMAQDSAALPRPPDVQPPKAKAQASQKITRGNCSFDAANRKLAFRKGGRVFMSEPLDTPEKAISGKYLDIFCGAKRTLLFSERSLVVTLGTDLLQQGKNELPGNKGFNAFSTDVSAADALGAVPVAWASDDSQRQVAMLGQNGKLLIDSDITSPRGRVSVNLSSVIEFPLSTNQAFLQHYKGMALLFQKGSRRIISIALSDDQKKAVIKAYRVVSACPAAPTFSIRKDILQADFGTSLVSIKADNKGGLRIIERKR